MLVFEVRPWILNYEGNFGEKGEKGTFYVELKGRTLRTPEGIARNKAELIRNGFQEKDLDPKRFNNLKPELTDTMEIAFDGQRFASLHEVHGYRRNLKYWNGKQYEEIWESDNGNDIHYRLDDIPSYGLDPEELSLWLSWPRSQPHSFWWSPRDVGGILKSWGRPEQFRIIGEELYQDMACYVLEFLRDRYSFKWYVGKTDRLLYGYHSFHDGKPLRLADLKGQVVFLHFWAVWCGP